MDVEKIIKASSETIIDDFKLLKDKYPDGKVSWSEFSVDLSVILVKYSANLLRGYHAELTKALSARGIILDPDN